MLFQRTAYQTYIYGMGSFTLAHYPITSEYSLIHHDPIIMSTILHVFVFDQQSHVFVVYFLYIYKIIDKYLLLVSN